jgi:hypothetical protein
MIPSDIKFDGNATPPQFTDNADQVIERGTHIRVKIKGIRGEVGQMYAIATIKEDFLGYVEQNILDVLLWHLLTAIIVPCSRLENCCFRKHISQLRKFTNLQKQDNLPHKKRCKEKRKEHTRLNPLLPINQRRKDAQRPYSTNRDCVLSWRHPASKAGEEGTIDGGKRGKKQKTPLISSFEIETPLPRTPSPIFETEKKASSISTNLFKPYQ